MTHRTTTLGIWSWLMLSTLIEVYLSSYSLLDWTVRDSLIGAVAITAVLPMALVYLDLLGEHISVKMFMLVGVFFSLDLVLIWTASLVH